MYCICLHLFLAYRSLWSKSPDGMIGFPFNIRMWFGVSASRSFGSSETFVMGLSFRIASTSQKMIWSPSSSRICCFRTEVRTLFTERIRRSQTPPWWEAAGMLKLQFMPSLTKALWILQWFKSARLSFSSRLAPTKFVPLSDLIDETGPRLQINLRTAIYTGVCIKCICNFQVYSPTGQTGGKYSIPFKMTSASFNINRAKIVNSNICKRGFVRQHSPLRQVCHLLFTKISSVASTNNTVRYYLPCRRVCTNYSVLLP